LLQAIPLTEFLINSHISLSLWRIVSRFQSIQSHKSSFQSFDFVGRLGSTKTEVSFRSLPAAAS